MRRHRRNRLRFPALAYGVFGAGGAAIAGVSALKWPMTSGFIVGWSILLMELTQRPGWVSRTESGLAGLTHMPRVAAEDLHQAAVSPESMAVGLWASTLSRSLAAVWSGLLAIGLATCWGRIAGLALHDGFPFSAWLWLVPLLFLGTRMGLHWMSPWHTLPYCLSTLERARTQWWRRHRPLRYFGHTMLMVLRQLVLFGALLAGASYLVDLLSATRPDALFDPTRPGNLLMAGLAAMALGFGAGAGRGAVLRYRRERYLQRTGRLIAWLLEENRALADAGSGQVKA